MIPNKFNPLGAFNNIKGPDNIAQPLKNIVSVGVFFPDNLPFSDISPSPEYNSIYGQRVVIYKDGTKNVGYYSKDPDDNISFIDTTNLQYCTWLAANENTTELTAQRYCGDTDKQENVPSNEARNDFDQLYPWSEMKREIVGENDNVMISIPKFALRIRNITGEEGIEYKKTDDTGETIDTTKMSGLLIEISTNSNPESIIGEGVNDFRLSKAFMRPDENNNIVWMNKYYIGAYEAFKEGDYLVSKSGKQPTVNTTAKNYTIYAKKNNEIDSYEDYAWNITTIFETHDMFIPLMTVESACRSSQHAYGQGYSTMSTSTATGKGDCLNSSYSSETCLRSGNVSDSTIGKNVVVYRGIENPWGNLWKNVNGITYGYNKPWDGISSTYYFYVQKYNDRTKMGLWGSSEDTNENNLKENNYEPLEYTPFLGEGYIKKVGVGNLISLLPESKGNSENSYFSDYFWNTATGATYRQPLFFGSWPHRPRPGSFSCSVIPALSNVSLDLRCSLIFSPLKKCRR